MLKLKAQHTLLAGIVLVALSVVYVLMAAALLRVQNANIVFTEKEIQGLREFTPWADFYINLSASGQARPVTLHEITDSDGSHAARVNAAASLSYNEELRTLRDIMRDIGDQSNIILDPELSSYYAGTLLINEMPSFVDLITTDGTKEAGTTISYRLESLHHAATSICKSGSDDCQKLLDEVDALEKIIRDHVSFNLVGDQKKEFTEAIRAVTQSTEQILKYILAGRLDRQIRHWNWSWGVIACLYAALVFLVIFSIQNYASQREIRSAREREKLMAELARKNDELEKFAYAAAHDLKEPVRTMRCYATLLRGESVAHLQPEAEEYVDIIEGAAKRAEQMINDLMGYSKVSEEALVWEKCDSAKEIAAVLKDLQSLLEITKPTITATDLPLITTVPSMFRRIILNALDNAVKYRRPDVPLALAIQAERQGDFWVFKIEDNGIGIAHEHLEVVFEPFRRLKRAPATDGQGIGLTSCRKIVERLGGKMWLESAVNQGTRVYFSLPVEPVKA